LYVKKAESDRIIIAEGMIIMGLNNCPGRAISRPKVNKSAVNKNARNKKI
jgi:hypothetical protein